MWMVLTPSVKSLNRTKKLNKGEFAPSLPGCLQTGTLFFSCLQTWTGTYTIDSAVSPVTEDLRTSQPLQSCEPIIYI